MSRDKDLTNKFSRDGYELGQSKNATVMQGQDSFGMSVEYLRKLFVKIRNPEKYPELDEKIIWNEDGSVQGIDNTKFKKAAMSEEEMSKDEKRYTDTVAKMLKDRILKDIVKYYSILIIFDYFNNLGIGYCFNFKVNS